MSLADHIREQAGRVQGFAAGGAPSFDETEPVADAGPPPFDVTAPVIEPDTTATLGSVAKQVPTGFNQALATTAGAPVDAATWLMNHSLSRMLGIHNAPKIEKPFGGSDSIKSAMGLIGANPDNAPAKNTAERIARGTGEGLGYAMGPEAAVGFLSKAKALGPSALNALRSFFGGGESVASSATNATVGAVSGGSGKAAAEFAPDEYKPLAEMAGGLAGGIGTVGAVAAGRAGAEAARGAGRYLEPLTAKGRDRAAARVLDERASDPYALRDALDDHPADLVPGSMPTTFQQTGDMGLGSLEREVAAQNPADFMQRRSEQSVARTRALEGMAPDGDVAAVQGTLRGQRGALDAETTRAVDDVTAAARARMDEIGGHNAPEEYGEALRGNAADARGSAKTRERALWKAVDPDDELALPVTAVADEAQSIVRSMPRTAAPIAGEEAAIFETIGGLGKVEKFNELVGLRTRINAELRKERMANGESPAYARMSRLRGSIEKAIEEGVSGQIDREAEMMAAGLLPPERSVAARIVGARDGVNPEMGNEAFTPSGNRVPVEYRVVSGDDLVTSNHPQYPQELQPRDRSRAASDVQIQNIAGNLQPERLGMSASSAEGAPIIGPGGVVESGNARTMAIMRAYQEAGPAAQRYRQYLESMGVDLNGINNPVLVRNRTNDMSMAQRAEFAREANASPVLSMSAAERAVGDSARLKDDVLSQYRGGDINSAENRDFVRAFMRDVPQKGESGALVTSDGALSLDGQRRVENALLHAAYDDSSLVARLAESDDPTIRPLGRALADVSGEMAQLRREIAAGAVDKRADIVPNLMDAVRVVGDARAKGIPLSSAMAQRDAFDQLSPVSELLLRDAYGQDFSGRINRDNLTALLRDYVAEARQQTTEARLFGEPSSADEILAGVSARHARQGRGSASVTDARPGDGAAGAGERRPETPAPGPERVADASDRVLEKPELRSNFDEAARGRLRAASNATKERARRFDSGPVGDVLKPGAAKGLYRKPASAVPDIVFKRGPAGAENVRAYRDAVGDGAAMTNVVDGAAASLRRAAQRPDGTLDPARFEAWRKQHTDALSELPGVEERFSTAARAARAIDDVAKVRTEALERFESGAIGKILGAKGPDEVTKAIGAIFGRDNAATEMARLVSESKGSPAALAGLRKAVADHVAERFISNTEAGTTGQNLIKSDQFQTFVRKNSAALRRALGDDGVNTLRAIAADLNRANRSISAVKLPGGSNTAQDTAKRGGSLLSQIIERGATGGAGALAGALSGFGPAGAAVGAVGGIVAGALREAGIKKVDDLVKTALLNPEIARRLLSNIPATSKGAQMSLAAAIRRAAVLPIWSLKDGKNGNDETSVRASQK